MIHCKHTCILNYTTLSLTGQAQRLIDEEGFLICRICSKLIQYQGSKCPCCGGKLTNKVKRYNKRKYTEDNIFGIIRNMTYRKEKRRNIRKEILEIVNDKVQKM